MLLSLRQGFVCSFFEVDRWSAEWLHVAAGEGPRREADCLHYHHQGQRPHRAGSWPCGGLKDDWTGLMFPIEYIRTMYVEIAFAAFRMLSCSDVDTRAFLHWHCPTFEQQLAPMKKSE